MTDASNVCITSEKRTESFCFSELGDDPSVGLIPGKIITQLGLLPPKKSEIESAKSFPVQIGVNGVFGLSTNGLIKNVMKVEDTKIENHNQHPNQRSQLEAGIFKRELNDNSVSLNINSAVNLFDLKSSSSAMISTPDFSFSSEIVSPILSAGKQNEAFTVECEICGKRFGQNSNYKNHMRSHSNEKPYICEICSVGFKERYHLKKHVLFKHTEELKEECGKCGKRFKDSTAVRAHERTHSTHRPYSCGRCGKSFKTSECLWHHDHRSKTCSLILQQKENNTSEALNAVRNHLDAVGFGSEMSGRWADVELREGSDTVFSSNSSDRSTDVSIADFYTTDFMNLKFTALDGDRNSGEYESMNSYLGDHQHGQYASRPSSASEKSFHHHAQFSNCQNTVGETEKVNMAEIPSSYSFNINTNGRNVASDAALNLATNTSNLVLTTIGSTPDKHTTGVFMNLKDQHLKNYNKEYNNNISSMAAWISEAKSQKKENIHLEDSKDSKSGIYSNSIPRFHNNAFTSEIKSTRDELPESFAQSEPTFTHIESYTTPKNKFAERENGNVSNDILELSQKEIASSKREINFTEGNISGPQNRKRVAENVARNARRSATSSDSSSQIGSNSVQTGTSSRPRRSGGRIRSTCAKCGKQFVSLTAFEKHIQVHSEQRPYRCDICDIGFKLKVHLKKHNLYRHNSDYPCKCSICGKRFKDSSAVRLHERIHSTERPFQCQCGKSFKTKENLWGHRHRRPCEANYHKEKCDINKTTATTNSAESPIPSDVNNIPESHTEPHQSPTKLEVLHTTPNGSNNFSKISNNFDKLPHETEIQEKVVSEKSKVSKIIETTLGENNYLCYLARLQSLASKARGITKEDQINSTFGSISDNGSAGFNHSLPSFATLINAISRCSQQPPTFSYHDYHNPYFSASYGNIDSTNFSVQNPLLADRINSAVDSLPYKPESYYANGSNLQNLDFSNNGVGGYNPEADIHMLNADIAYSVVSGRSTVSDWTNGEKLHFSEIPSNRSTKYDISSQDNFCYTKLKDSLINGNITQHSTFRYLPSHNKTNDTDLDITPHNISSLGWNSVKETLTFPPEFLPLPDAMMSLNPISHSSLANDRGEYQNWSSNPSKYSYTSTNESTSRYDPGSTSFNSQPENLSLHDSLQSFTKVGADRNTADKKLSRPFIPSHIDSFTNRDTYASPGGCDMDLNVNENAEIFKSTQNPQDISHSRDGNHLFDDSSNCNNESNLTYASLSNSNGLGESFQNQQASMNYHSYRYPHENTPTYPNREENSHGNGMEVMSRHVLQDTMEWENDLNADWLMESKHHHGSASWEDGEYLSMDSSIKSMLSTFDL